VKESCWQVTGRVQGVGFRAWTRRQAQQLGLAGWVLNEANGSVTVCAAGEASAVDMMRERLWQGPPAARVEAVQEIAAPAPPPPAESLPFTGEAK